MLPCNISSLPHRMLNIMIMCNPAAKTAAPYLFLNCHLQINSGLPALWAFVFIHFKGPHVPAVLRSVFLSRGLKWSSRKRLKTQEKKKEKEWPRSEENSRFKPNVCSVQLKLTMLNLRLNSWREWRDKIVSFQGELWRFHHTVWQCLQKRAKYGLFPSIQD